MAEQPDSAEEQEAGSATTSSRNCLASSISIPFIAVQISLACFEEMFISLPLANAVLSGSISKPTVEYLNLANVSSKLIFYYYI